MGFAVSFSRSVVVKDLAVLASDVPADESLDLVLDGGERWRVQVEQVTDCDGDFHAHSLPRQPADAINWDFSAAFEAP